MMSLKKKGMGKMERQRGLCDKNERMTTARMWITKKYEENQKSVNERGKEKNFR